MRLIIAERKIADGFGLYSKCQHPPERLYSWFAADGALCVGCCQCGKPLVGAAGDLDIIESIT